MQEHSGQAASLPLRERKKRGVRRKILATAIALFREHGSTAVPVAVIADACELSEATFFNYFPSKDALLAEWVHAEVSAALVRALGRPTGLRRGLRAGVEALVEAVAAERDLYALAFARARLEVDSQAPGASREDRAALEREVAESQRRGDLRGDIDSVELAAAIRETVAHGLARALAEGARLEALRRRTLARLDLVVDGARKRNERVRGPARG